MKKIIEVEETRVNGLFLFKQLIKDGCRWNGDVLSQKWSEMLIIPEGLEHQVELTLSAFKEGEDYLRRGSEVWIA